MKDGILTEETKLLLTNLLNGKSAYCLVQPDGYGTQHPDFIDHADLLDWGRETGCYKQILRLWNGKGLTDFPKWPFIAVTRNCHSNVGLGIFRNQKHRNWATGKYVWNEAAKDSDMLAFFAEERIVSNDYGKRPNRIPKKARRMK